MIETRPAPTLAALRAATSIGKAKQQQLSKEIGPAATEQNIAERLDELCREFAEGAERNAEATGSHEWILGLRYGFRKRREPFNLAVDNVRNIRQLSFEELEQELGRLMSHPTPSSFISRIAVFRFAVLMKKKKFNIFRADIVDDTEEVVIISW